ncbi:MAG: S-methyl-5'-thioadenosine phosphorylase, partial [Spirochaetes bacterium]|nr:S-methyl-5'-thioadenosine phosphorylase [Spirochaetota bacterium]
FLGGEVIDEVNLKTPWGNPSDSIVIAKVKGIDTAFLPRHGRGHFTAPHQVNSRANIAALKMLGVEEILAFSAVGSLKEEIKPLDFILPDQVIDRTRLRPNTFFEDGMVAHVAFADPFCLRMHETIIPAAKKLGIELHTQQTVICMEGPAFSTRAESRLYRSWGAGIINMSTLPEAKLAREAEICYSIICMSTDYDCWHESEEDVSTDLIIQNLNKNAERAKSLLNTLLPLLGKERTCQCRNAARTALITAPEKRNPEQIKKLKQILPDVF